MGKSFRYDRDDDGDGFQTRKQLRNARKQNKHQRRENIRQNERMDGGEQEAPFDVMSTINPNDWSR